ncbi:MAG: hypothetical protein FD123_1887 [Bacteroidetes bacterium]|nr:MAG: hypothetical protein FD123_1887 [Bacteroidota bacterium]
MKKLALLIASIGVTFIAQAGMIWKPGFVVTVKGDTVRGDVKINDKKEFDLFRKVSMKLSETENKTFKPEKLKEYTVDGQRFITKKIDDEFVFVKVVAHGQVNLYLHQFEVYHGEEVRHDSEYYIEKSSTASADSQPAKIKGSGKFKKLVAELMNDHEELVKKVQSSDSKYEGEAIVEVITEYNDWAKQNKG